MGLGFKAGRGFAIAKVEGNRWSAPCFVQTGGVSVGAIAGVEQVGCGGCAAGWVCLQWLGGCISARAGSGTCICGHLHPT